MAKKPPCEVCRHFAKKNKEELDCRNCKYDTVKLYPENEEAFFIYSTVQNQAIFAQTVPVDLNYESLFRVMDLYEVDNKKVCFEKVVKLWHKIASLERLKKIASLERLKAKTKDASKPTTGQSVFRNKSR
jgi:hypothetical protein